MSAAPTFTTNHLCFCLLIVQSLVFHGGGVPSWSGLRETRWNKRAALAPRLICFVFTSNKIFRTPAMLFSSRTVASAGDRTLTFTTLNSACCHTHGTARKAPLPVHNSRTLQLQQRKRKSKQSEQRCLWAQNHQACGSVWDRQFFSVFRELQSGWIGSETSRCVLSQTTAAAYTHLWACIRRAAGGSHRYGDTAPKYSSQENARVHFQKKTRSTKWVQNHSRPMMTSKKL